MAHRSSRWHRLRTRLAGSSQPPAEDGAGAVAPGIHPDVTLLVESALFDDEWYTMLLDRRLDRRSAAQHYLATGRAKGLTPHPLFAPDHVARQLGPETGEDPFVHYVRERCFELDPHPLFDVTRYVTAAPEALDHREGPLGHYRQLGAEQGLPVNSWYVHDPADPRGLLDWLWRDAEQWVARQRDALPTWARAQPQPGPPAESTRAEDTLGLTSVVLVVLDGGEELSSSIRSLVQQTSREWELLLVAVEGSAGPDSWDLPDDPRVRVVVEPFSSTWAARNHGLTLARGTHVAWMSEGDAWLADRLGSVREVLASGRSWAQDCARDTRPGAVRRFATRPLTRQRLRAGAVVELGTLVVSRELATELGGFDESLLGGQELDFALRLAERGEGAFLSRVGVEMDRGLRPSRPPGQRAYVDGDRLASARDAVLNEHLVRWTALDREREPGRTTVVVTSGPRAEHVRETVQRVVAERDGVTGVQVVLADTSSTPVASAVLASLEREWEDVHLVRGPASHNVALARNLAVSLADAEVVVFVEDGVLGHPGWLRPLLAALDEDGVLGAQPLQVDGGGAIRSCGVAFPRGGGLPHELLRGFPVEDSDGVDRASFHAVSGTVALRFDDLVGLKGFDPLFAESLYDVDLSLRLTQRRDGRFVVCPGSRFSDTREETAPHGSTAVVPDRRVFVQRWSGRLPEDDVTLWRGQGFDVLGHRINEPVHPDKRLCIAEPVLARRPRVEVREGVPRLRWALKNPARHAEAERWGDTHFLRQLGEALTALGQEVVMDHREAFDRPSGWHDDVVLLLRGLIPYTPLADRVNLLWLISNPEKLGRFEHVGWDRVYVASTPYARWLNDHRDVPAIPLLQATDPSRFHPGLAEPDSGHRVLFLGNSRHGQTRPMVTAAIEAGLPLRVIGGAWEGLIPDHYLEAEFLPNSEVGAAYRAAGLVLNDHWPDMRDQGFLSNRLFDAVAAGARVVSDDVVGLHEVFGDAVQTATSAEDLARIAGAPDLDSLFGSDEARRDRASRVAREHSFAARARVLLDDALRIRGTRGL